MDLLEAIRTRRSVRTFDGGSIREEDREKLSAYIQDIPNPFGIKVEFSLLDAHQHHLGSPVITGENLYIAAKVSPVPYSEEAFGYSFEKMVLYAWSLGIGTTWIGGTMKRELFEKAMNLSEDERMYCISPLGYPAEKMSLRETLMRKGVRADHRKPASELFFDGGFDEPLITGDRKISNALEAVRLAPSAVNIQPWRIVRQNDLYHFYLKHSKGYQSEKGGDLQKIDLGIALCHFMEVTEGNMIISDPGISKEEDTEYIASVKVEK